MSGPNAARHGGNELYWNPAIEKMSRDELAAMQSRRLRSVVERVYTAVPHYRAKMQDAGLRPEDVQSIDDLYKLPFTAKDDLRITYPFGMFAVPTEEIVRVHASSGTTGKQTVVGYTRRDLNDWAECMARCLTMAGATKKDRIQVSYGYGMFTGGLGSHYGVERIGAMVVPAAAGNTARQIAFIKDFGITVICVTPSYAMYLAEALEESGCGPDDIALKAGVFGGEPCSAQMRAEIEQRLGLAAYDIYGIAEIMGPAVSQECRCQNGLHIWEDYFIPEIIDPENGEVLPYGVQGELVFTTVHKQGFPMIRYRTRDITALDAAPCECGRTHIRMRKPEGRTDDMLIIRGVNVFPSQIESVLLEAGDASPHYQIIVDRVRNLDTVTVEIEVSESMFSDYVKGMEGVENAIRRRIESALGIACGVRLVEPKSIARSEGKAKRVDDRRKLKGEGSGT